jgi:Concanavalin A-like lectin/glucanases superfamily
MSTGFLGPMTNGLTAVYTRGLERFSLTLDDADDGTIPIRDYGFEAYQRLYGLLPPSPRYVLVPGHDADEASTVRVWFTTDVHLDEQSADISIPAGWPTGQGIAIPIPGRGSDITNQLRLKRLQPQPPASQASDDWEIIALLGNLAKLLWVVGREYEDLAHQRADVARQRIADTAHGASLDLLGRDLGAPRFPPRPYTWDPGALALYHLDDRPGPSESEVTKVADDRSRYLRISHPGQDDGGHPGTNNGGHSGRTGRFSRAFEFREAKTSISIPDSPDFAVPAGTSFTVEALIKPAQTATAPGVIVARRSPLNAGTGWALTLGSFRGFDHNLRFSFSDGGEEQELFADRDLGDGTFHHVAAVLDHRRGPPPVTFALLYLDGAEVDRRRVDPLGALTDPAKPLPVSIGFGQESDGSNLTDAQYVGLIQEVRISNVPRSSFHPVTGEDDVSYRKRLSIFQRWLLPTPDALQAALNEIAGPVADNTGAFVTEAFVVDETADPLVTATLPLRVLPAPLAPGQGIAADGDQRGSQADAVGTAAEEPDFDEAWLCRHEDRPGLDFGADASNRSMQWSVRQTLDALLGRIGPGSVPGTLRVRRAYDRDASDLYGVGRALLLVHDTLPAAELAVHAHAAGFGWVCHTPAGEVEVAQPRADVLRVTPLASGQPSPAPEVLEGKNLDLDVDPSPAPFADAEVRWSLSSCGGAVATLDRLEGRPVQLHAVAAGEVSVHVEVTRGGHTRGGSRIIRIGLADTSLSTGQSISGTGVRGVSEEAAAGASSDDFSELYLQLRTDDYRGEHINVSYGDALANRRMQRVTAAALDALLGLLAGTAGVLSVVRAYDPAGAGLLAQGRALWLRHSTLAAPALAARAFAAGFDYVRIDDENDPGQPSMVQVAVLPGALIYIDGPQEVPYGGSVVLTAEPQAASAAVCLSTDGGRAFISEPGNHRVAAVTVAAASPGAVPLLTFERSSPVAASPGALAFAAGQLFAAHELPGVISVLDPVTLASTASIATGPRPVTMATDGERLYVGCAGDSTLRAYDLASHQLIGIVVLADAPQAIAVTPTSEFIYVLLSGDRFARVDVVLGLLLSERPPDPPVATGAGARALLVTPDGNTLYVACAADDPGRGTGTVRVYRAGDVQQTTVITGFAPGRPPTALSIGADQRFLYVATAGSAAAASQVQVIDTRSQTLLAPAFTPGGTCQALTTSPAAAAYQPCLLAVCSDAATVVLADPAPLGLARPLPPRLADYVGLGSGDGDELGWSAIPSGRGRVELASLVRPANQVKGAAPGMTQVRASYLHGGQLGPYQCEVRLKPGLDAQPTVTIPKDQYDLVLNVLNWFHPTGVEVKTGRLRRHVVELGEGDLLPDYTYPTYRIPGPYSPPPSIQP